MEDLPVPDGFQIVRLDGPNPGPRNMNYYAYKIGRKYVPIKCLRLYVFARKSFNTP